MLSTTTCIATQVVSIEFLMNKLCLGILLTTINLSLHITINYNIMHLMLPMFQIDETDIDGEYLCFTSFLEIIKVGFNTTGDYQ